MNRAAEKRKKRIQLTFIYFLMVSTVVGVTAILVLITQGYRFNKYDGKIGQGGLVQFNSDPGGASVTVDSITLGTSTPHRVTLTSGKHTITMKKKGFRDWQKNVTVRPGSVLWLNYAKLIPSDIKATAVMDFEKVDDSITSKSQKSMVILPDSTQPVLYHANLDRDTPVLKEIQIDMQVATVPAIGEAQHFKLEKWDYDGRNILIKHTYGDEKVEWLVVDTQGPNRVINVNTAFPELKVNKIEFTMGNNQGLYVVNDLGELYELDIIGGTQSKAILSGVRDFNQYDNSTVVYSTQPDPATGRVSVGYLTRGNEKPRIVRTYPAGTTNHRLDIGKYYGQVYYALTHDNKMEILTGNLPASGASSDLTLVNVAEVNLPDNQTFASGFSLKENRFVFAQSSVGIVSYDLELLKSSTVNFSTATDRSIVWVDKFHFVSQVGSDLRLSEFDGQNTHSISSGDHRQAYALKESGKYFYNFVSKEGKVTLTQYLLEP